MKLTRFLEIVTEGLNVKDVKASHSFSKDLGADSLDMVELVIAMEDELDIDLPDNLAEEDNVDEFYGKVLHHVKPWRV